MCNTAVAFEFGARLHSVQFAKLRTAEDGSHCCTHSSPQRRPFAGKLLEFVHELGDRAARVFIREVLGYQPGFVGLAAAQSDFFFV
jgi:hypothetical protein